MEEWTDVDLLVPSLGERDISGLSFLSGSPWLSGVSREGEMGVRG